MIRKIFFIGFLLVFIINNNFALNNQAKELKVLGQEYTLEQGRLTDIQARQLKQILEKKYSQLSYWQVFPLWENMDKVYWGGKYQGEIMLMVFAVYIKHSFKYLLRKSKMTPPIHKGFGYVYDSVKFAEDRHGLYYNRYDSIGYAFNCIGVFQKNPNYYYKVHIKTMEEVFSKFTRNWKRKAQSPQVTISNVNYWKTQDGLIRKNFLKSVVHSAKNLKKAIIIFEEKVAIDDTIFKSGKFDNLFIQIMGLYPKFEKSYDKEVALPLFKALAKTLYPHLKTLDGRKQFVQEIHKLGIPFTKPVQKNQSLISI